ncbi:MAG: hypothetical protein ABL894_05105 [Hyphomicrobium sp.]
MPLNTTSPGSTGNELNRGSHGVVHPSRHTNWLRTGLLWSVFAATAFAVLSASQMVNASSSRTRVETACASILNVVNSQGSTFERHGSSLSAGDQVVRMLYTVRSPGGQAKKVVILCAFDGTSLTDINPRLSAVSINGRAMGPARLVFLNRFWLRSHEATAALPSGAPSQSSADVAESPA